jgi:hypothetical protein
MDQRVSIPEEIVTRGREQERELLEATITTARRKRGKRRRLKIDDLDDEPRKK